MREPGGSGGHVPGPVHVGPQAAAGRRLRKVQVAADELESLQAATGRARGDLVQALCEALALGLTAEEVASTAGTGVAGLLDLLRTPPGPSPAREATGGP